jgi:hypothetical protein
LSQNAIQICAERRHPFVRGKKTFLPTLVKQRAHFVAHLEFADFLANSNNHSGAVGNWNDILLHRPWVVALEYRDVAIIQGCSFQVH